MGTTLLVTVANPDRALTLIPTFNLAITTADVLSVDEYGATVQLIRQDCTRQAETFLLGSQDFYAIFGQNVPDMDRAG